MPDLNAASLEAAVSMIAGTARKHGRRSGGLNDEKEEKVSGQC